MINTLLCIDDFTVSVLGGVAGLAVAVIIIVVCIVKKKRH
jgi:hypothetical protein